MNLIFSVWSGSGDALATIAGLVSADSGRIAVAGGRAAALAVAARLELFTLATSLGGVESLVEHRASAEGPGSTTPDDLLRLSVGLEHPDDLAADLARALDSSPS